MFLSTVETIGKEKRKEADEMIKCQPIKNEQRIFDNSDKNYVYSEGQNLYNKVTTDVLNYGNCNMVQFISPL